MTTYSASCSLKQDVTTSYGLFIISLKDSNSKKHRVSLWLWNGRRDSMDTNGSFVFKSGYGLSDLQNGVKWELAGTGEEKNVFTFKKIGSDTVVATLTTDSNVATTPDSGVCVGFQENQSGW